uniref:Uncharacterized protein n=1 Tax=Eutreptiella gymnastica TaxID=73025 RepID=A0A7S4FS80_9EUGL
MSRHRTWAATVQQQQKPPSRGIWNVEAGQSSTQYSTALIPDTMNLGAGPHTTVSGVGGGRGFYNMPAFFPLHLVLFLKFGSEARGPPYACFECFHLALCRKRSTILDMVCLWVFKHCRVSSSEMVIVRPLACAQLPLAQSV